MQQYKVSAIHLCPICFEKKLVVEVDGMSHVGRAEKDAARQRYLELEGYRVIRNTSSFVCRSACLDDQRCAMYEFYRPNGSCGLFDHTRLAGSAQTAEVGVKTPVKTSIGLSPGSPPATLHLAVRQNAYVEGAGYRTLRQSSTPACRTACLADARCAMYEFHRPSRSCGLFDHTRLAGESDEAETGIKVTR